MAPKNKGKENILIEVEETALEWKEDVDVAIEKAISRVTRTEKLRGV